MGKISLRFSIKKNNFFVRKKRDLEFEIQQSKSRICYNIIVILDLEYVGTDPEIFRQHEYKRKYEWPRYLEFRGQRLVVQYLLYQIWILDLKYLEVDTEISL